MLIVKKSSKKYYKKNKIKYFFQEKSCQENVKKLSEKWHKILSKIKKINKKYYEKIGTK